jgi:hypothetical protein
MRDATARRVCGGAIAVATAEMDRYQRAYRALYENGLGADGVLGPAFETVLSGLLMLLNGELGPFDGGNLDREIRRVAKEAGLDPDQL